MSSETFYKVYFENMGRIGFLRGEKRTLDFINRPEYLSAILKGTSQKKIEENPLNNGLFKVEQPKGKVIGYFTQLEYASDFLFGEFIVDRLRNK